MMKDESGKWKVERRKKYDRQKIIIIFSVISLLGLMLLDSCSKQQPVSPTICGDGFQLLGGLDNMIEISNNEEWILVNCESNSKESKYVRVFRVDNSASWSISLDTFPWSMDGIDPLSSLASRLWSSDERSVYLRPGCCYDPTEHGVFVTDYGLYLLNLQTGELSVILSGENNNASPFSISISPDEKYLVYVDLANTPNILSTSKLQTGEEKAISLDEHFKDIGAFVWSPDNNSLVFVAVFDGWESSSLYVLEMNSFALKTIVENDGRLLFPTSKWDYRGNWGYWKDENTLFLTEFSGDKDWVVNIQTGVIEGDNSYDGPP